MMRPIQGLRDYFFQMFCAGWVLGIGLSFLDVLPAWGQDRPASSPCTRSGAPTDEMRCLLAITQDERTGLHNRLEAALAAAHLAAGDLAAAKSAAAKRDADLALWFKGYFGEDK